ncbi:flagellar basal body-associated FliL family protein [Clostridium sp. Marseille-P299]|uniref:flagellar basal body-associated FliL family protein n=1 Tax=Clostridium sp. Marseille-P299 TaxID=1805477 RepID=UPI0008335970|nr:flagellar basal body-associated FliL family protein [Clostridium sp. Marseille-P299]
MKKNILTIIILAATVINLTLTAVSLFVVIPSARRTDNLVKKVVSIIDLELESPIPQVDSTGISIEDIGTHEVKDITVNLKKSANDTKAHYAAVNCSLALNKKDKDYEKKQPLLTEQEGYIREVIQTEIGSYTFDTVLDNKDNIKKAIKDTLTAKFNSEFIIDVSFGSFIVE